MMTLTVNTIPILVERGADYGPAAVALGLVGAGQAVGRLGYPLLAVGGHPRWRTVLVYAGGAVFAAGLAAVPGPLWLLVVLAVAVGAARGCDTLLRATAVSDRWGTRNFGAINGRFTLPLTIGGALAPAAGPVVAELVGGYAGMTVVMAVLIGASAVLAVRT